MLLDHKACEMKAAATAMQLIGKYSGRLDLVNKMSRLAREELRHFEQVLAILKKRGIPVVMSAPPATPRRCATWCASRSRSG